MKGLKLITLFILFSLTSTAQKYVYSWLNTDSKKYEKFDLQNSRFYQKSLVGEFNEGENLQVQAVDLRDLPYDNHIVLNGFNFSKSITYFTIPGTGFVFEFNRISKTFTRIDKTFYKGYNFKALQFQKDGKIYSMGGSGFWKLNATFTVYNFEKGEWDLILTHGSVKPERMIEGMAGVNLKRNKVYVIEPTLEYEKKSSGLFRFFEFDLATFTWYYKGLVNIHKFAQYNFTALNVGWLGEYFYFKDQQENQLIIDPETNEMLLYKGENRLFWGPEQSNFYSNGYIYSIEPIFTNLNFKAKVDSIPINRISDYFERVDHFYETPRLNFSWYELVIIVLLVILVGFIVFYFGLRNKMKKNQHQPKTNELTYTIWDNLPSGGDHILDYVIEHGCDYLFTTDELSKLLGCDKKAFDTQRQYRSKFITQFNHFFEEHFNIDQAIFRISSEEDKRFICYQISEEAVKMYKNKE